MFFPYYARTGIVLSIESIALVESGRTRRLSEMFESHAALIKRLEAGEGELLAAVSAIPPRKLPIGAAIIAPGKPSRAVTQLISGWACRRTYPKLGVPVILDFYVPGDFIGLESALLPRAVDVVETLTQVTVRQLGLANFHKLLSEANTALHFARVLIEQQHRRERLSAGIAGLDAASRIAAMLLDLYARLGGYEASPNLSFVFPITHSQTAQRTGLTTVHVNRVLKRLREEGVLVQSRAIIIRDVDRLRRISEGRA